MIGWLQIVVGIAIVALSVLVMGGVLINGLLLLGLGMIIFIDGIRTIRKRVANNDIRGTMTSVSGLMMASTIVILVCRYIASKV